VWPMVTQGGEESDEDHRIVCTGGTGAWAQGGRDQRVGGAFNKVGALAQSCAGSKGSRSTPSLHNGS
jgi:hypothetical protein